MNSASVGNSAVASTKGTVYQLYVALQKCLEMTAGQKVYIERFGDVTIGGSQQVEVKLYTDNLTDNHENFWKTLANWMRPEFDAKQYRHLILCTTQQIGPDSKFQKWNLSAPSERRNILAAILVESEQRFDARKKGTDPSTEPEVPDSLKYQRVALNAAKNDKLQEVISRLVLADCSPDFDGLYATIRDVHGKGVLTAKRDDFCNGLLGHIICPQVVTAAGWAVTYESFAAKFAELTSQYHQATTRFPTKFQKLHATPPPNAAARKDRFVQKIHEIDYAEVIPKAVQDYLYASDTIQKDLSTYERPPDSYHTFAQSVLDLFHPAYREACRDRAGKADPAKTFYDQTMRGPVPAFPTFETPDPAFRNGVIHMHVDDADWDLSWKLT